jgi:putative CocE/NonD family hydrolase
MKATRIEFGDGVTLERGVECVLSDGVRLVSDHYYPAGDGPWPVVLMRQPYGRDIASTVVYAHPVWFARRGYCVVIQDVRGRGGSEGEFYPFRHEGKDGAETIAWLLTRPECNGRVGMYGFSYQGATQLLAAAERPAGLRCIAPAMAACDLYRGWFYHHGALRLGSTMGWGLQMLKEDAQRRGLHEASAKLEAAWIDVAAQAKVTPYAEHPALMSEGLPTYVREWMAHDAPGEFWESLDVSARSHLIEVPALHVSGWYDTYLEGSVKGFELVRDGAGTGFAREHQYLLAGPWVHIPWGDRVGEMRLGDAALMNTDELLLRWFDHWLKDKGTWESEPRVRHFALGVNDWREAEDVAGEAVRRMYLRSGGRAESRKGDGWLSEVAAESEPADVFVYDPEVPVMGPGGAVDQAGLEMGNNLLVYTGEELVEAVHVYGRPKVVVWAMTSAGNADVTAKLVRVMTSGRAEFVCMGIARSGYLFGEEYKADTAQRWEFTMEPTSCVFAVGERVRLEIAGCAFPLYDRNPSTRVKASEATRWNWGRSTHVVFHDAERPSVLELPVLERPAMKESAW